MPDVRGRRVFFLQLRFRVHTLCSRHVSAVQSVVKLSDLRRGKLFLASRIDDVPDVRGRLVLFLQLRFHLRTLCSRHVPAIHSVVDMRGMRSWPVWQIWFYVVSGMHGRLLCIIEWLSSMRSMPCRFFSGRSLVVDM